MGNYRIFEKELPKRVLVQHQLSGDQVVERYSAYRERFIQRTLQLPDSQGAPNIGSCEPRFYDRREAARFGDR